MADEMTLAPKRRWSYSLRRFLFWDIPYVALMGILLPSLCARPRPPDNLFMYLATFHEWFVELLAWAILVEYVVLLTLLWLLLPVATWGAVRIWRRWKGRKPAATQV